MNGFIKKSVMELCLEVARCRWQDAAFRQHVDPCWRSAMPRSPAKCRQTLDETQDGHAPRRLANTLRDGKRLDPKDAGSPQVPTDNLHPAGIQH